MLTLVELIEELKIATDNLFNTECELEEMYADYDADNMWSYLHIEELQDDIILYENKVEKLNRIIKEKENV